MHDMDTFRRLALFLMLLPCAACTSVTISDAIGAVAIERHFGFSTIVFSNDADLIAADVSFVGFLSTPLGTNLGIGKQSLVTANEACHIVVWVDAGTDLDELRAQLAPLDSVCITTR